MANGKIPAHTHAEFREVKERLESISTRLDGWMDDQQRIRNDHEGKITEKLDRIGGAVSSMDGVLQGFIVQVNNNTGRLTRLEEARVEDAKHLERMTVLLEQAGKAINEGFNGVRGRLDEHDATIETLKTAEGKKAQKLVAIGASGVVGALVYGTIQKIIAYFGGLK